MLFRSAITFLETIGFVQIEGKEGRKKVYGANASSKNNFLENFSLFQINPTIDLLNSRIGSLDDKKLKKKIDDLSSGLNNLNKIIKGMEKK